MAYSIITPCKIATGYKLLLVKTLQNWKAKFDYNIQRMDNWEDMWFQAYKVMQMKS